MGPLLSIKTIPFQYEMHINNAELKYSNPRPGYQMNKTKGGLGMKHKPAKIHIDSSHVRESMNLVGVGTAVAKQGKRGIAAAQQATARIAEEGNMLMDTRNKNVFGDIALSRTRTSIDTMLGFIPPTPSKVSFDPHQLSMKYDIDKLSFDWRKNNRPNMEFTPASIEFKIKNYARLEIEYLGGPNYIPKSADPDYVPPEPLNVKG